MIGVESSMSAMGSSPSNLPTEAKMKKDALMFSIAGRKKSRTNRYSKRPSRAVPDLNVVPRNEEP